jgi:hypothetical protein
MFNGFPVTNTPAVQVWDFFSSPASTSAPRSIYLTDDCAPIQYFRTGFGTTAIRVYLPSSFPEGKVLKFINAPYGSSNQSVNVYSSDASGLGTDAQSSTGIYYVGPSKTLDLIYSKAAISFGTSSGSVATGWLSLTEGSVTSNSYRAVAFGSGNATANNAFAACGGATASGIFSVAIGGQNNTASGSQSVVFGGTSITAAGTNSANIGGTQSNAATQGSVTIGGSYGTQRGAVGQFVIPACINPIANASGRQQSAILLLGRETTDATVTTLASNSSAPSTTNQLVLGANGAFYVRGSVIATVTGAGDTKAWTFDAAIKRASAASSTALVAAVVPVVTAADAGAAAWTIAVSADTTNGALAVAVTGAAATTIRWVCRLESTEVTF